MATPAAVPTAAVGISIGGLLSASSFGINVETISLGMLFAIAGMFGRFAFDIQKAIETGSKIRLLQTLGWTGAGLLGAPFLTIIWIVMLRAIGAQTDIATVIGLLFLGFTGPKGVTWLMGIIVDFIGQKVLPKQAPPPAPGG